MNRTGRWMTWVLAGAMTVSAAALRAEETAPDAAAPANPATPRDARMQWWREARFGMFIHWGLYSVLGGEWKGKDYGKEMGGHSAEWVMYDANIPAAEYEPLAKEFNPVNFDAAAWVGAAKAAGMKYMVITAKHHDGFSLFDSKVTDYDIMDASPFKRDIIKELADECRKQGLRFGVYYSHSKDWRNRAREENARPPAKFVELVKGQLRELLTNYGDLAVVWFDTGDRFAEINTGYGKIVQELQPNCLISGRLHGRGNISDYKQEGDRKIPPRRVKGDTETPMTLRDNWGYDRDENNWKTDKDMLERFSLCVCRGANMLLNVGPRPDGTLCPEELRSLKAIGEWMAVNGEAIYGTTGSPFDFDFPWGSMTQKGNRLYLHVLKWNPQGITFNGLVSAPAKAWLLADAEKKPLAVEQTAEDALTTVQLPAEAPGPNVNIVVLEFDGPIKTDPEARGKYHWVKGTDIKLLKK